MQSLLHFLIGLGYLGPVLMGVLDSSFLVLPFGNDLLVIALVARHHQGAVFYVLGAICGSTLGILLLDVVARKAGERGVEKVAGEKKFERLKKKIGEKGGRAVLVGCVAPPPFPFTLVIAVNSALAYPRGRLIAIAALGRAIRFTVLGFLAVKFGGRILRVLYSTAFRWAMIAFIAVCVIASVFSIMKWVKSRGPRASEASAPVA